MTKKLSNTSILNLCSTAELMPLRQAGDLDALIVLAARTVIDADRALRQSGQAPAGYFYRDDGQWKQAHDPMFLHTHTPLYALPPAVEDAPAKALAHVENTMLQEKVAAQNVEIAALKAANTQLEALCDETYVARGADAYNHACNEMEAWQAKRRKARKAVGTEGSLCDGIAWLYERIDVLETKH